MKIKCVAIDDEPRALELMEDYIQQIPFLEFLVSFRNPLKAIEYLKKNEVDLIFLDINMPLLSGIQLINTLRNPPLIILTTAYSEYAVKSYDLDVLYYLLKPIEFESFLKASNKALDTIQLKNAKSTISPASKEDEYLFVKDANKLVRIALHDILFIEAAGNYQTIHLPKRKVMTLMKMEDLVSAIDKRHIIRVHKSFAVNLKKMESVAHHRIQISNQIIPIGDSYKSVVYSILKGKIN